MNVYRLVYRKNADFFRHSDDLLSSFGGTIKREELDKILSGTIVSSEAREVLTYLSEEGLVKVDQWTVGLTQNGILFVRVGGYKGKARRKAVRAFAGIVATTAAVCTIVAVVA